MSTWPPTIVLCLQAPSSRQRRTLSASRYRLQRSCTHWHPLQCTQQPGRTEVSLCTAACHVPFSRQPPLAAACASSRADIANSRCSSRRRGGVWCRQARDEGSNGVESGSLHHIDMPHVTAAPLSVSACHCVTCVRPLATEPRVGHWVLSHTIACEEACAAHLIVMHSDCSCGRAATTSGTHASRVQSSCSEDRRVRFDSPACSGGCTSSRDSPCRAGLQKRNQLTSRVLVSGCIAAQWQRRAVEGVVDCAHAC